MILEKLLEIESNCGPLRDEKGGAGIQMRRQIFAKSDKMIDYP